MKQIKTGESNMLAWTMGQPGCCVFVLPYAGHRMVSSVISWRCIAVSSGRFSRPTSFSHRSLSSTAGGNGNHSL